MLRVSHRTRPAGVTPGLNSTDIPKGCFRWLLLILRVTGGLLTLPRLFRPVRRRPYHQVSDLPPSGAVQAEQRSYKRLAVNLAVTRPLGGGCSHPCGEADLP
jgi:hypothetical protein